MGYQNMLDIHALKSLHRSVDIPRHALGIVEEHQSIPQNYVIRSSIIQHISKKQAMTYDDLLQDSIGLNIDPRNFPNYGYLGRGTS